MNPTETRRARILAIIAALPESADDELDEVVPAMRDFYSSPTAAKSPTEAGVRTPFAGAVTSRRASLSVVVMDED